MSDELPETENEMTPEAPEQVQLHAIVHGDVQGVGFRFHTQREARQRDLAGWVQNRWDGTVEVVAEGPRVTLEQFEQFLHQGPSAATVERVEIAYEEASGKFRRFEIRY